MQKKYKKNEFSRINAAEIYYKKYTPNEKISNEKKINSDPIENYPIIAEKYNIKGKVRLIQVFTKN